MNMSIVRRDTYYAAWAFIDPTGEWVVRRQRHHDPEKLDDQIVARCGRDEATARRVAGALNAAEVAPSITPALVRLAAAAPDLLAAIDTLFPADNWAGYDLPELSEQVEVNLKCTRQELIDLFAAIQKAKGG